jgi:alcohol dehydrogenase (cytochrome c)
MWDYDEVGTHILIDGIVGGQARKLITHSARNGFLYTMERANGAMVIAKPYMEVNWTKGIDQKTGKPLDYDPTRTSDLRRRRQFQLERSAKKVCPSQAGGNNYWPSSFSPKTKLLYIPALSNCVTVTIDREKHSKEKGWNGGLSSTNERWESNLTAADPVTGEIKKSVHLRYPNYSGTLATGGGVVFLALLDGTIAAYDDTSLDELWKINVGSGFSAPPMTFEVNGKQYVAIVSGPSPVSRGRLANTPELKDQRRAGAVSSGCDGWRRCTGQQTTIRQRDFSGGINEDCTHLMLAANCLATWRCSRGRHARAARPMLTGAAQLADEPRHL